MKKIFTTEKEFIEENVIFIVSEIQNKLSSNPNAIFRLGLSGGSTPKKTYQLLSSHEEIDWKRVIIFLIDDRIIKTNDSRSNQNLIHTFWSKFNPQNFKSVVFPKLDQIDHNNIQELVSDYEKQILSNKIHEETDLNILGMGGDGHIASLFPLKFLNPSSNPNPTQQEIRDPKNWQFNGSSSSIKSTSDHGFVLHTQTNIWDILDRITVSDKFFANQHPKSNPHMKNLFLLDGEEKLNVWNKMSSEIENKGNEIKDRWPAAEIAKDSRTTVHFCIPEKK